MVAEGGKIVSVSAGEAPKGAAGTRIDAHGMTVMAAFIDAHRHLFQGNPDAWLKDQSAPYMKSFLDAGFTTVFSMGDDPKILELRRRLNSGEIAGPTLYSALIVPLAQGFPQPAYPVEPSPYADPGRTDPARPPNRPVKPIPGIPDDATRATIRQAKQAGYDAIKTHPGQHPRRAGAAHLGGDRRRGAQAGPQGLHPRHGRRGQHHGGERPCDVLAHTPHIGHLEEDAASRDRILAEHIPMVSTLGRVHPALRRPEQTALPRRRSVPDAEAPGKRRPGAGQRAHPVGGGARPTPMAPTTQWDPRATLNDELRALNLVFSPRDIIKIMGPNTAAAIDKGKELGTLEPGKTANIVLIDGDPHGRRLDPHPRGRDHQGRQGGRGQAAEEVGHSPLPRGVRVG